MTSDSLTFRIRPAPVVRVDAQTRVTHRAEGFEPYFGETAATFEVSRREADGRWRDCYMPDIWT